MNVRSRWLCAAAVLVGLSGIAVRAGAETCSLELKKVDSSASSQETYILRATYPRHFSVAITEGMRFGGQEELPDFDEVIEKEREEYNTQHPVRGVIKLGSQHFGYVLDSTVANKKDGEAESKKSDNEDKEGSLLSNLVKAFTGSEKSPERPKSFQPVPYDRLYLDRDGDGDLTDEQVIEADSTRNYGTTYYSTSFPQIDVTIEVDSTKLDYALNLSINSQGSGNHGYVSGSLRSAAYREGEIELEGKKHRIVLLDFNSNGLFNDEPALNASVRSSRGTVYVNRGDRFYIDPDVAKTSRNPYGVATDDDFYDVAELVPLEGKFYRLEISPAGDKFSLTPADVPVGYVSNPNKGYRGVVYGDKGFVKLRSDESGKAPLPVGKWKLQGYAIDRTGFKPNKPKKPKSEQSLLDILFESLGPTAAARKPGSTLVEATATTSYDAIEVREGETTPMPFGPPYRPMVDVQYRQGMNQVSLGLSLVGSADEVCSDMQINGNLPGKPKFTITTADGEKVAEGQFEYG